MQLSTGEKNRCFSLLIFLKFSLYTSKPHFPRFVPQNTCSKTCTIKERLMHTNFPLKRSIMAIGTLKAQGSYSREKWLKFLNLVFPNLIWPQDCILFMTPLTSFLNDCIMKHIMRMDPLSPHQIKDHWI